MVKQKNIMTNKLRYFIFLLTFFLLNSCGVQKAYLSRIEASKVAINQNTAEVSEIDTFIKPYRDHIDGELSEVLAYNPTTLDKKAIGKWQTNIGNLMADISLQRGNLVFNKREGKNIDICLLNYGGIRSILPQGNLTMKNAYQVMPFENSLYIVAMRGTQIIEMCNFIIGDKKAHPISGIQFMIGKDNLPKNILIEGHPLENDKLYFVATNDYLMNGGDNMNFFKTNEGTFDMDYKLRNILIDYLKEVDSVQVNNDVRITEE
jgi:2',3'-cyclic-nucleotide 2'-phosphodiesterase (5'-nucleotidase family)